MGKTKLKNKNFNGRRYCPVIFGGHSTGTKTQAEKISANLKRYQIPNRIIKITDGEYAVYRME